jgi:K+ transporter
MTALEQQFNRVQEKLLLLLKQQQVMQKEIQQLRIELEKQQQREQSDSKHIEELKQQVQILKLSTGDMNEKDKKAFEKKINGYLREIDRCITLLSR